MPSLLLVVFILQLVIHIINTVGAPVIDEFLWSVYNKLPTSTSQDARSQIALRRELVKLKQELNGTSSQDEFAKWAKLRRNYDKKMAEYDEKANKVKSVRATFDRFVTIGRFLSTNGLRFFLQFWYSRKPMYWIPSGWAPGYIEWILSFPRAPTGAVSIQIWGIACATVIQIVGAAIVAGLVLVQGTKTGHGASKAQEVKMDSGGSTTQGKKEL